MSRPRPADQQAAAAEALAAGDLPSALALLDRAAAGHREAGQESEAAIAMAFAAGVARALGDDEGSWERATTAASATGPDPRAQAAAFTALGEAQLARRDPAHATLSLALAVRHEADPVRRSRLLRLRGTALWAAGAPRSGGLALLQAARLLGERGDVPGATALLLQRAEVLRGTEMYDEALGAAEAAAADAGLGSPLAATGILRAADAVDAGDLAEARRLLDAARDDALADLDPLRYAAAARGLSAVCLADGDDVGAYAALATGWATLADLVGEDGARLLFRPPLVGLWEAWGEDRFATVKAAYETGVGGHEGPPA